MNIDQLHSEIKRIQHKYAIGELNWQGAALMISLTLTQFAVLNPVIDF